MFIYKKAKMSQRLPGYSWYNLIPTSFIRLLLLLTLFIGPTIHRDLNCARLEVANFWFYIMYSCTIGVEPLLRGDPHYLRVLRLRFLYLHISFSLIHHPYLSLWYCPFLVYRYLIIFSSLIFFFLILTYLDIFSFLFHFYTTATKKEG